MRCLRRQPCCHCREARCIGVPGSRRPAARPPINVWGEAPPRETLSVSLRRRTTSAQADELGHWRATLPGMKAGGPYQLSVRTQSGRRRPSVDVMVGDVWLCCGPVEHGPAGASRSGLAIRDRELGERLHSPADRAGGRAVRTLRSSSANRCTWQVAGPRRRFPSSPRRVSTSRASCKRQSTFRWADRRGVGRLEDPVLDECSSAACDAGGYDEALDVLALYEERPGGSARTVGRDVGRLVAQRTQDRPEAAPWSAEACRANGESRRASSAIGSNGVCRSSPSTTACCGIERP